MRVISTSLTKEASKLVVEKRANLLVLDTVPIYLPGLPSLRQLKQEVPHLRVILIPRFDEKPDVAVARIAEVDAVLVRPLSRAKLLSELDVLFCGGNTVSRSTHLVQALER